MTVGAVETIGIHDFKPLGGGKVSVTLNNGNMGAFVTDEKTAEKLKEKYRNEAGDSFKSEKDNKPKMTEKEAIQTMMMIEQASVVMPFAKMSPTYYEAIDAIKYYNENRTPEESKKNKNIATGLLAVAGGLAGLLLLTGKIKIPASVKNFVTDIGQKISNILKK